jgi:hypothetical protein
MFLSSRPWPVRREILPHQVPEELSCSTGPSDGGNAGCEGGAGLSCIFVSVPSTVSEITLFDGSKPPMLAMYVRMPTLTATMTIVAMITTLRMI